MKARTSACAFMLLAACTRREPVHSVEGPSPRADADPNQVVSAAPAARALALTLSVERTASGVGLHVMNDSPERVELAGPVLVARAGGPDAHEKQPAPPAHALVLRLDCAQQGCVTLDPGGELVAPSFLGQVEGERCDALFRPDAPGEYELVVRSCRGDAEARARFRWDSR